MTEITKKHKQKEQYLPVFISNHKILLIGGGNIALAKLRLITEFTNQVTVVAEEFNYYIKSFTKEHNIETKVTRYNKDQLQGYDLIIAATNNQLVNTQIAHDAKKQNLLVNVVDNLDLSNFIFGSVVQRGSLIIAISSNGIAPVLTRLIKQKIENLIPHNFEKLTDFISKHRPRIKEKFKSIQFRRLLWQDVFEGRIAEEVYCGNEKKAEALLNQKLEDHTNRNNAALYLIGGGPGDPELITLKAIRLISKADVILYDRLVAKDLFRYARKEVTKVNVGKTKNLHRYRQSEINDLIKKYLAENKIVVRLKGGDTAFFANLVEEIAVAKDLGLPYQIIPGITAASGTAAYLGIPLTLRDKVRSARFLTYYEKDLVKDSYWKDLAKSKDSLVFYMSANHSSDIVNQLLKYGMDKNTPIIAVEQATTTYQKEYLATLADFNQIYAGHQFASPSIIIVGEVVRHYQEFAWHEQAQTEGMYFEQLEARDT